MGKPGSFPSSPRRRRGGGRGARLGGVARGREVQREGEWGQDVAGVPRVAVEQQEVAGGPPWQRRGGGRGARLGGMARGGGILRGVEWGQEVAEVPRVAVEQQEVACSSARRRAALYCASSRAKQRGREVGDDCWTCL